MQTIPQLSIGGSDPEQLLQAYVDAADAVQAALDALRRVAPNGRDYVGNPGGIDRATAEHRERCDRMRQTIEELSEIACGIADQKLAA